MTDNNKKRENIFLKVPIFLLHSPICILDGVFFQKVAEEIEGVPDYLCVLSTLKTAAGCTLVSTTHSKGLQ